MNASEDTDNGERPCGLIRRLMAMAYDAVVVVGLLLLATSLAMLLGMPNLTAARDPLFTAYLLLVWFFYLGWCWNHGAMTLGMRAWRVRIVNQQGRRPTWAQCAVRFLVAFVSAGAVGLGFVWTLFERRRRTWHDLVSHTRLMHQPAARRRNSDRAP